VPVSCDAAGDFGALEMLFVFLTWT